MQWLMAVMLTVAAPASAAPPATAPILLRPAQVFDGVDPRPHPGWQVLVRDGKIVAAGPALAVPEGAQVIDLPGQTLIPGLIEGHGPVQRGEVGRPGTPRVARVANRTRRSGGTRDADGRLHDRA